MVRIASASVALDAHEAHMNKCHWFLISGIWIEQRVVLYTTVNSGGVGPIGGYGAGFTPVSAMPAQLYASPVRLP